MIIHPFATDLKQRKNIDTTSKCSADESNETIDKNYPKSLRVKTGRMPSGLLVVSLGLVLLLLLVMAIDPKEVMQQWLRMASKLIKPSTFQMLATTPNLTQSNLTRLEGIIGDDVLISFQLLHTDHDNKMISLGPHRTTVTFLKRICSHPTIALRLVGDALVFIPLQALGSEWVAEFYLPIAGNYQVDARWYGCDNFNRNESVTNAFVSERLLFSAVETKTQLPPRLAQSKTPIKIFPTGFWRTKTHFEHMPFQSDHVWTSTDIRNSSSITFYTASSSLGPSTVVFEPNYLSLKGLSQLSNYEVVCFVGTSTASLSRETFLSLRPQLAPGQRPFKFHYYAVTDLMNPLDSMNSRRMSRKCKQTFVMMDELKISKSEFKTQIVHFLNGVAKCMNDTTWSIWMFTMNSGHPDVCHSSPNLTAHHPCNDVLFEIFESNSLPSNVRLVDNTDVSNAQIGENAKDVTATIAMRIAALIGAQVDKWRAAGQAGREDGLHRNGVVEDDPAHECQFNPPT